MFMSLVLWIKHYLFGDFEIIFSICDAYKNIEHVCNRLYKQTEIKKWTHELCVTIPAK